MVMAAQWDNQYICVEEELIEHQKALAEAVDVNQDAQKLVEKSIQVMDLRRKLTENPKHGEVLSCTRTE